MRCSVLVLAPLALALVPSPAQADPATPVTIVESIDFDTGVATFTATGPLCSSGTLQDEVTKAVAYQSGRGVNLLIDSTYTCDDGSGTFTVHKHVDIVTGADGVSSTNEGPVVFTGGTGDYAGISGNGHDTGTSDGVNGVGVVSGRVRL